MPEIKGAAKLSDSDQAKVRMLQAKVGLAEVGFNIRKYREIQKALIRVFPELNTIESGKKLQQVYNLHSSDTTYINYFERLVEAEKQAV